MLFTRRNYECGLASYSCYQYLPMEIRRRNAKYITCYTGVVVETCLAPDGEITITPHYTRLAGADILVKFLAAAYRDESESVIEQEEFMGILASHPLAFMVNLTGPVSVVRAA